MTGISATTGRPIDEMAHLRQSIADILTTPIGSRVMRRTYGSRLFSLLDQPGNAANRLRIYAATADALARWEPRLALQRLSLQIDEAGQAVLDLEGEYRPGGRRTGEIVVIQGVNL